MNCKGHDAWTTFVSRVVFLINCKGHVAWTTVVTRVVSH